MGFLKKLALESDNHVVMYDAQTLQMLGITESFFTNFGVSSDLIVGNQATEFLLEYAMKDLVDQLSNNNSTELSHLFALSEGKALETYVDTTGLRQMYYNQLLDSERRKGDLVESGMSTSQNMLESYYPSQFKKKKVKA